MERVANEFSDNRIAVIDPDRRYLPDFIQERIGDTDWDRILNESSTGETTQDTGAFNDFGEKLTKDEGYLHWKLGVTEYLRSMNLHKFLDVKIPRPRIDGPLEDGIAWANKSKRILGWLKLSMSWEMQKVVESFETSEPSGRKIVFADEWMYAASKAFFHAAWYTETRLINSILSLKRKDFSTTSQFIETLRYQFNYLRSVGSATITTKTVVTILMHQSEDRDWHYVYDLATRFNEKIGHGDGRYAVGYLSHQLTEASSHFKARKQG